jgi:carbon monoxide dehydrogenase subunit G
VPTVRRSRKLAATADEIWAVVGDPHQLPRWWPRVARVESVDEEGFTQVLTTTKGRPVRADFRVVESVVPHVRRWEQQLENTPFERILAGSHTEVRLEREAAATRVELSLSQRPRGVARLGGPMLRAAARRLLDEALDGLQELLRAPSGSAPEAAGPADPGPPPR